MAKTASGPSTDCKGTGQKNATAGQFLAIINWLKIPENFKIITGAAAHNAKVVAGVKLSKQQAYQMLGIRQ